MILIQRLNINFYLFKQYAANFDRSEREKSSIISKETQKKETLSLTNNPFKNSRISFLGNDGNISSFLISFQSIFLFGDIFIPLPEPIDPPDPI